MSRALKTFHGWSVLALLLFVTAVSAMGAEGFHLDSVGFRAGFPGSGSGKDFNQAEFFADWDLPWRWDLGKRWCLRPLLDTSLGWLGDRTDNAAIATTAPLLLLSHGTFPVTFEAGIGPTLLSQHDFGTKDFGIKLQFTSHAGLNWDFSTCWRLSYRFQHMSNGGLSHHNPGLNLQMLGISYLF